ncbi:hypothetical protein F4778DRAFT_1954 [Xylariomycetidae sp. FL2044]|nr:hypothetical protein F4778DRAFT_1954 [Xylariomycetidae sp. FL2044]
MIPMQRSLSSPVRIHSAPPGSPTVTQESSRSPTPSPESRPTIARLQTTRPRSPTKPPKSPESTVSLPVRAGERATRHDVLQTESSASAQKKPVIDQDAVPPGRPAANRSDSVRRSTQFSAADEDDVPRSTLKQPLLSDVSLYTNTFVTQEEQEGTTLAKLAHWVQLSKSQERKRANTRIQLQRILISTSLSARLTRCGEVAQRNLAEFFRLEEKRAFANLYNAVQDVRHSCDATRQFALLDPDMEFPQPRGFASSESLETPRSTTGSIGDASSVSPFLNEISASAREEFLNFLTQIRTNPDYLATRLCALNSAELQALTALHRGLEPVESVLPFHSRPSGRGQASGANRNSGQSPTAIERLLSFQRHDPLSALIHTCFANSAGPDSAEDKRRTDIWARACARLLTSPTPNESLLYSVLNVWSSMRDWLGRSNMEWFLMKILEDGAFLLNRADDPHGTRFNHVADWTPKDNIAGIEFYDRAVNGLFEIIDDEDATGIPEGIIELGNEILRHLEKDKSDRASVDTARNFIVGKWLFSSWLVSAIIHPEYYGMMSDYHITEYGRQKILKVVAQKAQEYVVERLYTARHKPVSTPLKIKAHIENIMARFKSPRRTARLMPARSVTSLRETVEVHPYLVISPADLLTLVNALFPERRPQSAHSSSLRSGAPSISGLSSFSQPISTGRPRSNFDTASVLSLGASSVLSDATTSLEPSMDDRIVGSPSRYSPPPQDSASHKRASNYEDDGYRLRLAMHEMVQILGTDVVAGSCHPCAERWTVLFVSADGNSLSLQMTYDPDDDPDEENSSTTSDTDDDDADDSPELSKDYHQLRDSILQLVEDFEIPQGLEDSGSKTTFSNRASGLKKYRSKNKVITAEKSMGSRNPYRKRDEQEKSGGEPEHDTHDSKGKEVADDSESNSVLIAMLRAASSQSRVQSDFVSAHLYWKTLQQLNSLAYPSLRKNGFALLLDIFSRGPRDSLRRSASAIEEYDAWLVWLKQSQERHKGLIDIAMKRLKALRDKMWYVTDVHHSGPYSEARSICNALKTMGEPRKYGSTQRPFPQLPRTSATTFIHQQKTQILDILAAPEQQGGPNKLKDDQVEKTNKWLERYSIENLCKGEERIHRFCCEIHTCVGRLVGETINEAPVLWSSELYLRDKKTMEAPRAARDRDSLWGTDDAASVVSGESQRRYTSSSGRRNSGVRDLRNMSALNTSQLSMDSSRSFSRASTAISDILDSQDYFGVSSPIHAIDSSTTFWSPFQPTLPSTASSATSRAHSPATSVTNLTSVFSQPYQQPPQYPGTRPGTSASSNETIQHLQRLSEEKERFLSSLQQTLTSLLLSDLGNIVFSQGSETDAWFKDLGQECIERERRAADERRVRRSPGSKATAKQAAVKHRVIEKKKSSRNLRVAGETATGEGSADRRDRRDSLSAPSHDSSGTSDTLSTRPKSSRKDTTPDFPYKKAYQRLLGMFSVHPNPYVKLNALFELEHLITASMSGRRRSRMPPRSPLTTNEDSVRAGKERAFAQTFEGIRARRPSTYQASAIPPVQSRSSRNTESTSPAHSDSLIRALQALFKDPTIRPKSLFRDLQYINSFIPNNVLDTENTHSFWTVELAAYALKQDVVTTMIEVADEAVANHNEADVSRSLTGYSLPDAAKMWMIAAKEGNPAAQREFGLGVLMYPHVIEKTTMPLSRPRDIFKQAIVEKFGANPRSGAASRHPGDRPRSNMVSSTQTSMPGMQDSGMQGDFVTNPRTDPVLMCIAIHWLEEAARGGDQLARNFIEGNEMMGSG